MILWFLADSVYIFLCMIMVMLQQFRMCDMFTALQFKMTLLIIQALIVLYPSQMEATVRCKGILNDIQGSYCHAYW